MILTELSLWLASCVAFLPNRQSALRMLTIV